MSDSEMPKTYSPEAAEAAVHQFLGAMGVDADVPEVRRSPGPRARRAPDVEGPHARAWVTTLAEDHRPDQEATLSSYLVYFPASHPFWPTYLVAMIHLRDMPGVPPANKDFPEAEYEFMIVALDPEGTPGHPLAVDDMQSFRHLTPINVRVQFNAASDDDARQRCTDAVTLICQQGAGIEPDDDARVRPWWTENIRRGFNPQEGQHR